MIGRTPEFLGKKLESREMIMAVIVVVAPAVACLIFAGIAAVTPAGLKGLGNAGPHGLSEILYAFFSAAGNNGSAFAGLNANTPFYNLTTSFCMLSGPLPHRSAGPGHRRLPRREKAHSRQLGNIPHGWRAFRGDARGGRDYRGRPDVLSRPCAGAGPRSSPARRGQDVLGRPPWKKRKSPCGNRN